jgi:hypothetical protein
MFLFLAAVAMRAHPTGSRDILDLVFDLAEFTSIGDILVLCFKRLSLTDNKNYVMAECKQQHYAGIRLGQ